MSTTVVAEGIHFGEGPRWHQGRLWFSDFHDHAVKTLDASGRVETQLEIDDQPSGLGWLPDGRLLVVAMHRRRLLRVEDDAVVVHADLSNVASFHCNDMVVDRWGRAYVGNFGFDLDAAITGGDFAGALASYEGATLAMVDTSGTVHSVAAGLRFPNGSVLSPDGGTLVVAETLGRRLTAFDVGIDGTLTNRRIWADLGRAAPDGICLDEEGAIWVADATGNRCLRVREDGDVLQTVHTTQPCYACMLGGDDGRTLFMLTAESSLASVAAARRTGRIETVAAPAAHAGRP
jgi:sugar lactone lactonase YvrE